MRFDELSGDSTVVNVRYHEGSVRFRYFDHDTDVAYDVIIPTDRFISERQDERDSVHMRVSPIAPPLEVEARSGRSVAPADFGRQMAMSRRGLHLAIGLREREYPLFLRVGGYAILVGCPIRSIDQVHGLREREYPLFLRVGGYAILVGCPIRSIDQVQLIAIDRASV
jgi:hypothetical protein